MSSVSLGKKPRWNGLPKEIRLLILEALMQDACTLELERHNFARIKLTPPRLIEFGSVIHRNRALVRYIWFCLELDEYDCTKCAPTRETYADYEKWEEAFSIADTVNGPITTAFKSLFSTLSTWEPRGDLILGISIYSPSDSEHWFKYLTFMPDTPSAEMLVGGGIEQTISSKVHHDPQHGWIAGLRHAAPPQSAGPFDSEQLERQWWDQLPLDPAVTSLLFRQQNRRRWKPCSLAHMFARFPRLQEVHYEPWREWGSFQRSTDRRTWKLAIEPSTIQAWEAVMHQYGGWRLDLVQEWVDEAAIQSHGDAIYYLMLSSQVIRPISLRQIRIEQEALEGVQTL
ncbi:hypothetical protein C8A01DRAFT_50104 [Parachaetomium inaequale]|uniref:DUF6546 domain-containing protein n=1 Tax=Parachaetomium inaequale TaxID=2588326 RepID=A0AAN6PC50_9PEZI|nr:hypothetical protein C8A01DRAFT_50104 [Parachaetomium inaequale]